jgi:PPOX class probable F420-dependent enzyme
MPPATLPHPRSTTSREFADVARSRYVALTTYRRDGTPVTTPVWQAFDGASMYVQTARDSGKAKRIRSTTRVAVARCRAGGRIVGPAVAGVAQVVGGAVADDGARLLRRKYGWQKRLALYLAARRGETTVIVRIVPEVA